MRTARIEARQHGLIGPNAVSQLLPAMRAAGRECRGAALFAAAGATDWLRVPPTRMVSAERVAGLHRLFREAGEQAVLAAAGRLTADYLLAARIPRRAQTLLRVLPPRPAAWLLTPAIAAHAWTFAGAGAVTARAGSPTVFEISDNPLCAGERATEPLCGWHAAVFERLYQALVSPAARARETACGACGDAVCRVEIGWRGNSPQA